MPTPPPRKFFAFQIHLSTAIVMMFVAGGLIWANVERSPHVYGWPVQATVYWIDGWRVNALHYIFTSRIGGSGFFDYQYITLDVVVAIILLAAVYFLCEYLLRRRSAQKSP